MPTYIVSYRKIESPSRREIDALREIPGITVLDHHFGVLRITSSAEKAEELRQRFPDWNLSQV